MGAALATRLLSDAGYNCAAPVVVAERAADFRHALAGLSRGLVGVTTICTAGTVIANSPSSTGGIKDTLAVMLQVLPSIFRQLAE
ncbi:hypothetical protein QP400_07810 [Winkia sp. UMB3158]|uniref:Uncharacterized protein n=2 Tax=Winkia neuii TaxID=33007 RepID=K0YTD7_9ACTO|nr:MULTISPECIES: hypothetical protein [Winkia]MDK8341039.1 hypothetical protein [Winkia sp. UMB3164B]OFT38684.1 hypothetical protein HMPREF3163_04620 [Actinomyces sp. HMSC08A01]PLB80373.1 hypothetical protein CYJ21_06845 [Actinomyces sp. UMB0138]PMC94384.1 hypothetical protein CJ188_03985 [Actinomyces sp. UMB0918]EJZ86753.1 hypothetical protein HMPREF9240_01127 [Winkia neuii BV029A5]